MIYAVTASATGALENWVSWISERSRLRRPPRLRLLMRRDRPEPIVAATVPRPAADFRSDGGVGESKIMPNQSVPHASGLKKAAAEPKQRDVHRICISRFICIATRELRNKTGNYFATSAEAWRRNLTLSH